MTTDQIVTLILLAGTVGLFVWGRWRVDVVALAALVTAVIVGLVPAQDAFAGFGHPAVITVTAVLGISSALARSGVVDLIAARIERIATTRTVQLGALSALGGTMSGFMNNVGALALLMPVALSMARRTGYAPALILMPLSFATILGGLVTLIGTPPNVLIADYRRETTGTAFALFDFAWVGLPLAVVGIVFLIAVGWRLLPQTTGRGTAAESPFDVEDYLTELLVPEGAKVIGASLDELVDGLESMPQIDAIVRGRSRVIRRLRHARLQAGDVLLTHGETEAIEGLIARGLTLVAAKQIAAKQIDDEEGEGAIDRDALAMIEAVVPPRAWIEGRSALTTQLRSRYGINLLAVARAGSRISGRLRDVRFQAGDVLLLQGARDQLADTVRALGCLPLAERKLALEPRRALVPLVLFGGAIAATITGVLPAAAALTAALVAMVLARVMTMREVYEAVDWQVIVLLAAMIPVGAALETSGTAQLIGSAIAAIAGNASPHVLLALVLIVTMTLSDLMNNAATAVVMAPISVALAGSLGVSADPMLMAVAVGASSAFLTPIGHQNNLLVMGPGGYRFGDYWRMGLPLEVLLVGMGVWLIPLAWPF